MNPQITDPCLTRRAFARLLSAAGLLGFLPAGLSGCTADPALKKNVRIVILGGGAAGLSVAARLRRLLPNARLTVLDPAEWHYYQPGFTFIGADAWEPEDVGMREADLMPKGVDWLREQAVAVEPDKNLVVSASGKRLPYDFLVLAPGLQLNWSLVEGIDAAHLGQGNAHSIYSFEGAVATRAAFKAFTEKGGRGVFADTWTKLKCGGAPKKMCLLAEHRARLNGVRGNCSLAYFTASKKLYDVPYYTPRLEAIYRERNIPVTLYAKLKGVDVQAKVAHFEDRDTGRVWKEPYDFLHFAPPQSAPDFVRKSGLGWTEGKLAREAWAMADPATLVHKTWKNIVCVGDVAGVPTSKTSAAIRKQAPVAARNLCDLVAGREPSARYDGYAACPIITDYGHVIMAEFDYAKKPATSFPFTLADTSRELRSGWWLKCHVLKPLYFHLMLKGLA